MNEVETSIRIVNRSTELEQLINEILDPGRQRPIVALTARNGGSSTALSPHEVKARTGDGAIICCLGAAWITREMERLAAGESDPRRRIVVPYNGAAIIWWPCQEAAGFRLSSRSVVDYASVYGADCLDQIEEILDSGPEFGESGTDLNDKPAELLAHEREKRRASDREARELREELRDLRRDLADTRKRLSESKVSGRHLSLLRETSETDSLQSEVAAFWADHCMQDGRKLAAFSLGSEFESSLGSCELASRKQVIRAVALLVGGLDHSLSTHALRIGSAGNDPQRRRLRDGAKAFRCYIREKTPGAPRLHFWKTPSGHIELSTVVVHDDSRIVA